MSPPHSGGRPCGRAQRRRASAARSASRGVPANAAESRNPAPVPCPLGSLAGPDRPGLKSRLRGEARVRVRVYRLGVPSEARTIAHRVLVRVDEGAAFASLALDAALKAAGRLDRRDAALAT